MECPVCFFLDHTYPNLLPRVLHIPNTVHGTKGVMETSTNHPVGEICDIQVQYERFLVTCNFWGFSSEQYFLRPLM